MKQNLPKIKIGMEKEEVLFVISFLKSDDIMLEWGAGGSTILFPHFVWKYYSVEHDREWYDKTKEKLQTDNVIMFLIKNNAPRTEPTKRHQFKDYVESVHKMGVDKFDVVLIDGRARVWCAKEVLPYLKPDSIVFIHDFYKRAYYSEVLKWYDEVDGAKTGRTIVALKPKND